MNETGLTYIYPSSYEYSQSLTVTNRSGSIIHGPVYVVTIGEPTHYGFSNDSGLLGSQLLTTCFSPQGDYLLLVSGGDIPVGQNVGAPLLWFTQSLGGFIQYSTKVLSGTPSH